MTPANKLIDKAKEMCEGRSYAALARRLVVTPQTVHQWKNGDVPLPTERIVEIAKIAHLPVDEWVLRVLSDQSKGEARRVLEGVMKKIGYAAAIALCAIGLSMATPQKVHAFNDLQSKTPGVLPANAYYVKPDWAWWARLVRWWLAWKLRGSRSTTWSPFACSAA